MRPRSVPLTCLALLAAATAGCDRLYSAASDTVLGPVTVTVHVVAAGEARADRAFAAAFAAISQVNNLLSSHVSRSEVSRLNASGGRECHVSGQTAFVLRRAAEISELSGGAFDVTAGPLIKLWKQTIADAELFKVGETDKPPSLPDEEKVEAAMKLTGRKNLVLGENTAKLAIEGMNVDLGGIAKGYAVDKAVEALRAAGVNGALVDAGGDGRALGTQADGTPWRVAVQDPNRQTGKALSVRPLILSDMAYATSGDYEQYAEVGGVRYAHIVDPRTGRPARAAASVTVIALDCTTADALATAVSVLGADEGIKLVAAMPGVECMVITRDGEKLNVAKSPGFDEFCEPATAKNLAP